MTAVLVFSFYYHPSPPSKSQLRLQLHFMFTGIKYRKGRVSTFPYQPIIKTKQETTSRRCQTFHTDSCSLCWKNKIRQRYLKKGNTAKSILICATGTIYDGACSQRTSIFCGRDCHPSLFIIHHHHCIKRHLLVSSYQLHLRTI